jgi:O-antigen ligase
MAVLRVMPTLPSAPWIPGDEDPIIWPKGGDVAVQVGAAFVAYSLGLVRLSAVSVAFLAASAVSIVSVGRSPLLAVAVQIVICLLLMSRRARLVQALVVLVLGIVVVLPLLSGLEVRTSGERDFSAEQLLWNFLSLVDEGHYNATMEFRWLWWTAIVNHILTSRDFWFGTGFGDTLAIFSAFPTDPSLRSPHNIFVTILGRMGVIGLVAWCLLLASWAWRMLTAMKLAWRAGEREMAHRFVWLLGYGTAMVVNAATDVAFEGPMAGVWFWCLIGFSLAYARQLRAPR